jgi:hypothetical protein
MKPIVSTFLVSFLFTLGLTGCTDYGEETAGVEDEGLYQEETEIGEEEGLYQEEQEAEIVEQPGIGTEQETEFGEQEGIAEEEQEADVRIVEEGEELDLPEESPAAGEQPQQEQQPQQ